MFITRRALVAVFLVGFSFCLIFIAVFNPFDVNTNIGTTNIFLSPSSTVSDESGTNEVKEPSDSKPNTEKVIDLAMSTPQPSPTQYPRGKIPPSPVNTKTSEDNETSDSKSGKEKVIDLAISSPQPSPTLYPRGKVPPAPAPSGTETTEVEDTSDPESNTAKDKLIGLVLSTPQPSPTQFPRGKGPAPAPDETKLEHKIPDSNLHVMKTKDILDFVHRQCQKYNMTEADSGDAMRPRKLMVPKNWKEHMMIYASNPKTGSTSFKKWYHRIQGSKLPYTEIKGVHMMKKYGKVDDVFNWVEEDLGRPAQLMDAVKPLYKIVAVRNPLTKLMSGFRDKVLRRAPGGVKPWMLYFNPNLTANSTDAEKYAAFVEYVATKRHGNVHYSPQWQKMRICDFPYDMIMQTETTNQQIKEVQKRTKTEEFEFPGSRSEQGYDSVATVNLAHEFYSLVSPEVMEKFYYYFRWDFILLGYTKLDNPNFPYLDFNQDMDKEFGYLLDDEERKDTDPSEDDESPSDDYTNNK